MSKDKKLEILNAIEKILLNQAKALDRMGDRIGQMNQEIENIEINLLAQSELL